MVVSSYGNDGQTENALLTSDGYWCEILCSGSYRKYHKGGGAKFVIFSIRGGGGGLAASFQSGTQLPAFWKWYFLGVQKGDARPGCPPLYEPLVGS